MAKTLPFRSGPADQRERDAAANTGRSVIVQAPAGSGKTSLLTERFLRLLATVDDPKRVLAITFTRNAAAEMRSRAMQALTCAAGTLLRPPSLTDSTLEAAHAALETSKRLGWDLLEQRDQLNIQTIDSLALSIARQTPLTTSLGPDPQPTENAQQFYKQAALRTLQRLEQSAAEDPHDRETASAVALLLRHRDNQWQSCATLLAAMLEKRDQWGRLFPLANKELTEEWLDNELRPALENHLRGAIEESLRGVREMFLAREQLCRELLAVSREFAPHYDDLPAHYENQKIAPPHAIDSLPHWLWLANICFTKGGEPRKRYAQPTFPADIPTRSRSAAAAMAANLCRDEALATAFLSLRDSPPTQFDDDDWRTAKAMFRLLRQAIVELKMSFAQSGVVDFTEIGLVARAALNAAGAADGHPSELAFTLSEQYQHLLVDEFQDTSLSQIALLESLITGWDAGEDRTVFLVGDPQQSIYMFRQAEVRLFNRVKLRGLAGLALTTNTLTVNFRSHRALVKEHNTMLAPIFDAGSDVKFVPSVAHVEGPAGVPLHWHFSVRPSQSTTAEEKVEAQKQDAQYTCELVRRVLANPGLQSVAILVRAKTHALRIMRGLHARKIGFRAIDMEPLSDRQEVLDVFSLTRAILNPSDRVAWLALLRAPWCGVRLAALDALAGDAKSETIAASIGRGVGNLSADDQARTRRVLDAVAAAQSQLRSSRLPFAVWQAWQAIGGDACVNAEQYENVGAYFSMLERMDAETAVLRCDTIEAQMERLCAAPNPAPAVRLEIMTIHRAKGLEFDAVIVPSLHRWIQQRSRPAVEWIEDELEGETAWFLAPVEEHGGERSALYEWIRKRHRQRETHESARLFYVAVTRARRELHLLGAVEMKDGTVHAPRTGSLLLTAWPAARDIAQQQLAEIEMPSEVERIAAAAAPAIENTLCRLPQSWRLAQPAQSPVEAASPLPFAAAATPEDAATRAGFERRAAGTVLHSLLEHVARRRAEGDDWPTLQGWAQAAGPRIERLLIAAGVPPSRVPRHAANVHKLLQTALASRNGRWLFDSRPAALTEYPVTAWSGEAFTNFRIDRVFPAGDAPLSEGDSHLWLVDYKSAALAGAELDAFLTAQTAAYSEKMLRYAAALRAALDDPRPIRCALYFAALDLLHQLAALD